MPRPCHSSQGHGTAWPSRVALWANCPRSASSAYHAEFQEVIKRIPISDAGGLCETRQLNEEKLIILVQGHQCLYNLQHKDCDNLVKDNCWKEIAGEVHAQGKEQATQYFVPYRKAYWWYVFVWYYSGDVTALFILVEECKSTWARLRSYYRKALPSRKSTSGQAARKVKKWRFQEQMRFLQNHFQERGRVVIKMIHVCKLKKSNTSERFVLKVDNEDKSRYFILYKFALF